MLLYDLAHVIDSSVVVSVCAQDLCIKEIGPYKVRAELQSFLEHGTRANHIAFLHDDPADVDPPIRILGIDLGDFLKRELRDLGIALQEEPDAIVVPAL